jgi:cytochrome c553
MPAGDVQRGQQLYEQQFCASCHGRTGSTPSVNWPSVAGQRGAYSYKLLLDYQQGRHAQTHAAALMRDAVWGLNPQQLADLAAYSAQLPAQPAAPAAAPAHRPASAVLQLVRHGDASRLVTACASCHGARGEGGHQAQPALAGQNPAYLVRTLLAYHGGTRANDPARGMRSFAARLTRSEVDALALYYAGLPSHPR